MAAPQRNLINNQDPVLSAFVITPHDTNPLADVVRGIYVGTAGDLTVLLANDNSGEDDIPDGTVITFANAPVGYHPLRCVMVMNTGTTADDLVGLI